MNYYEYTFRHTADIDPQTVNDILCAVLGDAGFESFVEEDDKLMGYIPEKERDEPRMLRALYSFPLEGVNICFSSRPIEVRDWNEEWEKNYFRPVCFGLDCIIHAPFHTVDAAGYAYDIIIDPKMAFGTGNHETTALMIEQALGTDFAGKTVLDMGCGTAILAILATKMGAARVVAIDIDEWACNNALLNINLNNAQGIALIHGGAERIPNDAAFDIVMANINRNILLRDIPRYADCMKPGALLIMSGFFAADMPLVENVCIECGLSPLVHAEKNRWVAVKTVKRVL
ncbi:MAG: 50S ribosomal protein L11 methyltransferase [Tannerellaceae bacterium]|jgi:ribosomal protein L11 methyltransferase|nr:50S ribosomal protein L11 methyltransferase [Tannerellaceae bacterium]